MKVRHDGKVWDVIESTTIDDKPAYQLSRPGGAGIVARGSECSNPIKHEARCRGPQPPVPFGLMFEVRDGNVWVCPMAVHSLIPRWHSSQEAA
jgi:hypothetical protein